MKLIAFRVQMYKCVLDSGWVSVIPLTSLVGKNESGKTSLLMALHKFNPLTPEPYIINSEWPRGHRKQKDDSQVVCSVRFELSDEENDELGKITGQKLLINSIEISRDYGGRFEVTLPEGIFQDKLTPSEIIEAITTIPEINSPIGESFRAQVEKCIEEAKSLTTESGSGELTRMRDAQVKTLQKATTDEVDSSQYGFQQQFIEKYTARISEIADRLKNVPDLKKKVHDYALSRIPPFIFMDEYRTFSGSANLDQVRQRRDSGNLTDEDKVLLMILALSGLDLDSECRKSEQTDREQRLYDLDDAAATINKEIENRWNQSKYEVVFAADGYQFFTFVKGQHDRALIKLDERSRGFQWFFSFDLLLMHESKGTLKDCVLLLDEPGLHLHPGGQRDLLDRLSEYAKGNTIIYTTHLPFLLDLQNPDGIKILSETSHGTVVYNDLSDTKADDKLTLQAALGFEGGSRFLVAQRNLIVEGIDDLWILTELSNLLIRSGKPGLPEDVFISVAGGPTEAAYLATFMIGQKLDVVVLLDTDQNGEVVGGNLVRKWLTRCNANSAQVLNLGPVAGIKGREFSIEDLFPEDSYRLLVEEVYKRELKFAEVPHLKLEGTDQVCKKVSKALANSNIKFNKTTVSKIIKFDISKMRTIDELPKETVIKALNVIGAIVMAFQKIQQGG
jgi:predicted ATPase/5S rRNA maturation endonuclease (ribonuclease M5)